MAYSFEKYQSVCDKELLTRLSSGDKAAVEIIYHRYAETLYHAAFCRLPVQHKAEDLVQEVFINLYKKREEAKEIDNLKAWLLRCMRNLILNEIRNYKLHELHHFKIATFKKNYTEIYSTYDLHVLETLFHKALAQLTDKCREVFLLSRTEQLPNKKIAERLAVSEKAVEKQLTKALRTIRRELQTQQFNSIAVLLLMNKLL